MNLWDEPDSLAEDDYLAAPGVRPDDETGDDDEELAVDFDSWYPELGFPDQFNAVRVWCEPDGELTKVRLSLNWREKVGESGLSRAFGVAFMVMNNYYPVPDDPVLPEQESARVTDRLSGETVARVREELAELYRRLDDLPPEPESSWRGTRAQGSDYEDGVIVVLDIFGRPEAALFDPAWLKTRPTSSQIARGVLTAYRQARRRHTAPEPVFSERALVYAQIHKVNDRFMQMLGNGVLRT